MAPDYIITNCNNCATILFPCLKQQVYAGIKTVTGQEFFGANWMLNNKITECPRITLGCASGTGYEHCEAICGQGTAYHAERQAINMALAGNANLFGATLYLTGHTYCCDTCIAAMIDAGIKNVYILGTDTEYHF